MKNNSRLISVLLIDDDEDEYIFIRDLLLDIKNKKFKLEWTKDLAKAKDNIIDGTHDVFLLDNRLGKISGIELLKQAVKEGSRSPVILLTGFDDEDIDKQAMSAGAADYLQKSALSSYLLERSLRYAIYRNQMKMRSISQDRMASIGLLASSLAHEIGTPLGVIRGRAELLAMQAADNQAIKNNVDIIASQIDRVSGLVRSLLNLAKGDISDSPCPVSINLAVTNTVQLLQHEFQKNNIVLDVKYFQSEPLFVLGQKEKLEQILLNILMNAIHAIAVQKKSTPERESRIEIDCADANSSYKIEIKDNGCGMSEDTRRQLFVPFYSTKSQEEGTGLGLATSKWIVEGWSGHIDFESQEQVGTIFHIYLQKA